MVEIGNKKDLALHSLEDTAQYRSSSTGAARKTLRRSFYERMEGRYLWKRVSHSEVQDKVRIKNAS